ncbi:glycosyltransferase family 4 protein [Corynebacterium aurimucosum]|uniref:Mannosyltransferase n=1 Tax=Corynebacterium aurimucosum (strain ATCC 700975 / DSM 44827 / CIP 107346 / CN-1) TaxID=548476 RepID=C3PHI2_CORA7|nr:glycosyltransferase family 4 protein [Corynebacterium aurimucosum]ACP33286.1 mannosyltransferase [Corynebacterium aurimucosum ATCC 700975]QQU92599.1 glycosyltransferase family 4 protein [Corynebacterium aurimucosum]
MARILLVTNDFPPTIGGIQSYLRDFLATLNPQDVVVFASTQDRAAAAEHDATLPYTVVRWPRSIMLPTPTTARRMQQLIREHDIETVWFGAAAPLALMAPSARAAGASRIVATTHGHEVGWSMLPVARQALRRIGQNADVITYISEYTRNRLEPAFGSRAQWVHLPSAVNLEDFTPATREEKQAAREHFGLGPGPVIVCISRLVPRKGQDQLLRALPEVRARIPDAQLLIIGRGRYEATVRELARLYCPDAVVQEARDTAELRMALHAADVFAMPARTRGGGLDVEGLGIVYLEAQAAGLPVVAGDSGGAPETVTPETGIVVRGSSVPELEQALCTLLGDIPGAHRMGEAGRRHVEEHWTWEIMGARLREVLECDRGQAAVYPTSHA